MENKKNPLAELGILTTGLMHEMKTPLQSMLNNVLYLKQINRKQKLTEEETEKVLNDIMESVDFMISLTEASHFYISGIEDKEKSVVLKKVIKTSMILTHHVWKRTAEIRTELPEQNMVLTGSPNDFMEIMINLITNAAHAIENRRKKDHSLQGVIRIKAERDKDRIRITVSDNGEGIPEDIRNKIFNPFFTTKTVSEGSGQGLPIIKTIIEQKYSGSITFQSMINKGTDFIISIPDRKNNNE